VQPRRAGLRVVPRRAVVDPVCGSAVDTRGAVRRRIAGDTLYFCSPVCARRFAEDPERFA
jgi:YHS domain-containing protein